MRPTQHFYRDIGCRDIVVTMTEELEHYFTERKTLTEAMLQRLVSPKVEWPAHLRRAIRYSIFPGGKRLRPILAIASFEAVATVPDLGTVLPVAAALELLHTYTKIHDDLPQLDDSDLRRTRPTNHRVYGEALAILAGDALQGLAFQVISDRSLYPPGIDSQILLDIVCDVARTIGEEGSVGGQSMDLGYEGEVKSVEHLAFLFSKKTGGDFRVAVICGARLAGAAPWQFNALATYGDRLGLAYQITDDLLDDSVAKTDQSASVGSRSVPSIVELMGERACRSWCDRAIDEALQAIGAFDERAEPLRRIAQWIPERRN